MTIVSNETGALDYNNCSLADFLDFPDLDIMGRANKYREFEDHIRGKEYFQYKRESLSGSGAVRQVRDQYSGELREMIYLASNDYLNLTNHPKVVQAGIDALLKYGAGAGSVPLLGGTIDIHLELERKIAKLKSCESAIISTSGYGSNCSSLLSLLGEKDIAILDMLAHASLIDGCSNSKRKFFKHNCPESLENILKREKDNYRTKLVIVDGVYSMDGDICRLEEILYVTHKYGAYLMVDEAHATGVLGKNGRGTPEHFNLEGKIDIVCGTFSKAVGSVGGFVAGNENIIKLLNVFSRGYMFSTAMSPQSAASSIAALNVIETEPVLRENLWKNVDYLKKGMTSFGFNLGKSETAIIPVIIGDDRITTAICLEFHKKNVYVNPVVYPAVGRKSSRIRMSVMAKHTPAQLDKVLQLWYETGLKYKLI